MIDYTNYESLVEKILIFLNIGYGDTNSSTFRVASVILAIAIILFAGFLMTRLTKILKLPNVTAYIITGILLGPFVLKAIPWRVVEGMSFLADIALAFIAFGAGEFFKVKDLKKAGSKVIVITLFESLTAFTLVFILCNFVLKIDTSFSLVLAALSSATAPASTIMTIRQTGAKGEYVNTLLEVVALDDVVTLLLYSMAISVCIALGNGTESLTFWIIVKPILLNLACLVIGFGFGFLLKLLLPKSRTTDNRLIIVIALLFLFCGICSLFDQSPLLGCMAIGMVYTNLSEDDNLFKQLNYFTPPIMLMFFVRSGLTFNLGAFTGEASISGIALIVVSLVYFAARIVGKYGGAFLGGLATKSNKKVRNYLGMGLIPQAGVAIGLAAMGSRTFISAGHVELGEALNTIILASSVLYELVGPACSKLGLYLSKSYSNNIEEITTIDENSLEKKNDVEILIERIKQIQNNVKPLNYEEENEKAFNEAAEEYEEFGFDRNYRRFINHK